MMYLFSWYSIVEYLHLEINGLMEKSQNFMANTLELHNFCINPLKYVWKMAGD